MAVKGTDGNIRVYIGDISNVKGRQEAYEKYYNSLSGYRKARADCMKQMSDKIRAVGAGVLLKMALEEYGLKENDLEYQFLENGKPYIKDYPEISFSLAHSGERVMCVTAGFDIGCDVERVRERTGINRGIAKRFFTDSENRILEEAISKSEKDFNELFYKIWTHKESYIKYTGEGLKCPMDSFSVIGEKDKEFVFKTIDIEPELYRYALCFDIRNKDRAVDIKKIEL